MKRSWFAYFKVIHFLVSSNFMCLWNEIWQKSHILNHKDEKESLLYFLNYSCLYTLFSKAKIWHDMPSLCHMLLGMFLKMKQIWRSKNIQALIFCISNFQGFLCDMSVGLPNFRYHFEIKNGIVEQNLKQAKLRTCDHHPKQVILLNYVSNQWYSFFLNYEKITLIFFLLLNLLHYDRKCIFWYSFNNIHVINYHSMI